jgi:hypothetical protein
MGKKKKTNIVWIILVCLIVILAWHHQIRYFIFKTGMQSRPFVGDIKIEMDDGWYPFISSERGLGLFIQKIRSPDAQLRGITFKKIGWHSTIDQIVFLKYPTNKYLSLKSGKYFQRKSYHWGDIEFIQDGNAKIFKIIAFIDKYQLVIRSMNLTSLNEIVNIERI